MIAPTPITAGRVPSDRRLAAWRKLDDRVGVSFELNHLVIDA